jgi:phosphate transport system substrate-binding protein
MKFRTLASIAGLGLATVSPALATDITGAGSTFAFPLYSKWAEAYRTTSGNGLNYQSIGSGGGIRQIKAKTVDFGASDMPLKGEELQKDGLVQFPSAIGAEVPAISIPGVEARQLKLTGPLLADIYLGKVKKWDDPQIKELNPDVKLPSAGINVVYRSDGSGTTFVWTDYLSRVSEEWKSKIGANTSVSWPLGVGGKGNEGVSATVKQIPNSIGYVEYAYAKQNKMAYALVRNKDGKFPVPEIDTFQAAAANADWKAAPSYGIILNDQPGEKSWPITSATFVLMQAKSDKPEGSAVALKFFDWAFSNGDKLATDLEYVPLPANVKDMVRATWKSDVKDTGGKPLF